MLRPAVLALLLVLTAAAASAAPKNQPVCRGEPLQIPGFVIAQPIEKPQPRYPTEANKSLSEGWVLLEYAVGVDGIARDVRVVDALGPKDFVKAALAGVARWRYQPATRNGVPVEQPLYVTSILFRFLDTTDRAEHRSFFRQYNRAHAALQEKRYDDAIAILDAAFREKLNLYEQAMGSFAFAYAFNMKNEVASALYHIRHATIEDGAYLEKENRAEAFALQVEIEARNGGYGEACCAFKQLKAAQPETVAEESAKLMAQIEKVMDDPKPLVTSARLARHPLFEAPAVWRHVLLRRKFSFAKINGDVKGFRLACAATAHEAAVDEDLVWNVPAAAGPCILRLDGAPGASALLIEEW